MTGPSFGNLIFAFLRLPLIIYSFLKNTRLLSLRHGPHEPSRLKAHYFPGGGGGGGGERGVGSENFSSATFF